MNKTSEMIVSDLKFKTGCISSDSVLGWACFYPARVCDILALLFNVDLHMITD